MLIPLETYGVSSVLFTREVKIAHPSHGGGLQRLADHLPALGRDTDVHRRARILQVQGAAVMRWHEAAVYLSVTEPDALGTGGESRNDPGLCKIDSAMETNPISR